MRRKSVLTLAAIVAACVNFEAYAHSPMDKGHGGDLSLLVDQSNLVFIGKVERVEYRNARSEDQKGGPIPYTIVTYRIGQVLRGKAPGEQITMRLLGGPDGRGGFLSVTGVPVIQEGDQDLLFVGNTNDPSCPLVFCEMGRYRILNEAVFDTYGSPVRDVVKTKVVSRGIPPKEFQSVRFPVPKFDDLIRNPEVAAAMKAQNMSVDDARRRYQEAAPKYLEFAEAYPTPEKVDDAAEGAPPPAKTEEAAPMALSKFLAITRELIARSTRKPAEVRSVDPRAEIVVAKLQLAVPRKLAGPTTTTPKPGDADEYRALAQNGFNPVIRK